MEENNASAGVAAQDQTSALVSEVAELRRQLASLQAQNVIDFPGEPPLYLLNDRCQLDATLYEAGTLLEWPDVPNLCMVPQNEPAQRAMEVYVLHLESCGREVSAIQGRSFRGIVDDRNLLIDFAREHAKTTSMGAGPMVKMPEPRQEVPAMTHLPEAVAARRRNSGRAKTVAAPEVKPGPAVNRPRAPRAPRAPLGPNDGVLGSNLDIGPAIVGRAVAAG